MINNIIHSKIDRLSTEYTSLTDKFRENRYLSDKDARRLSEVSYQLKILKEIKVEANI